MAAITKDTKVGATFDGKPKRVSWERLWTFSGGPFKSTGWPARNIHTNLEFAVSCGLPSKVAASATQYMGYVTQLMIDLFGVEWLSHGTMDVRFVAIVDAGDTLVTRAAVQSKEARTDTTKFIMDVYCENQRHEKVLIGLATGCIGKAVRAGREEYDRRLAELRADTAMQHDVVGRLGLEPLEFLVTPELNQQFLYGEEDFYSHYIEETEGKPPIVHPALVLNWSNGTRSPTYSMPAGRAGLHTRDETFFYNPARVGKKLRVSWKPVATYERRGRPYSIGETVVVDEDGPEIVRRLNYSTIAASEYGKGPGKE